MDSSIDSLYAELAGSEEALGSDVTEVVQEETEQTPVSEELASDVTPEAEEQVQAEPQQDWNPDGPGDIREALRQEREQLRLYREQMLMQQQQLEQYQAWYKQQQEQAEAERQRQYLEELADDPEQLQQYLHGQQQAAWQQAQQQQQVQRVQMAAEFARQAIPDFDAQLNKIYSLLGHEVVDSMAMQQENPALWAYQFAKNFATTPDEVNARVEAEVQRRLAEIAPRAQVKTSTNSRGIGHLPASGKPVDAGPEADLFKALNFGVNNTGFDAAYGKLLEAASQ
jgi:hypothetical protein